MTDINAFQAYQNSTVNLAVTNSSGNVALPTRASNGNQTIRIYNKGATEVFIRFGTDSTVVASASTDMPIAPGEIEVQGCPASFTYVAGITASSTATIYFTLGFGT